MKQWKVISFSKQRPPLILGEYAEYWQAMFSAAWQQFWHPSEYIDIIEQL